MNHPVAIVVVAFVGISCAFSPARADFVPADAAEPRYEISLTASQDLSDWLAAQNPAQTEITGGGTIVVSGAYTLSVSTVAAITGRPRAQNSSWHAEIVSTPDGRQSLRIAYTDGFTIIVR